MATEEKGDGIYLLKISLVAALGGLLFGYDTAVISGAIGFLGDHFTLDPASKGWAASSALVGCMAGALFAGRLNDQFGRRLTLLIAAFLFLVSAIGSAVPEALNTFIIYRIIGGIGVGIASMTSPLYIAEISPPRVRGRMVSLNQFAIIFGMLVVYFVNYYIADPTDESWNIDQGWRWMFGSEAIPAGLFLLLLFTVPESPRWLIKKNRDNDAEKVLTRIGGETLAQYTMNGIRASLNQAEAKLSDLLKPNMSKMLIIGVVLAIFQQITGINVVLYYAPEIFKSMGYGSNAALMQTIIVGAVNLTFTIVAIWTVDKFGRKPLLLVGSLGMGIGMLVIGFAAYTQNTGSWVLIFMLGYIAAFAVSMGPVVWVLLSEIFPTNVRGKAMGIATVALWAACFVVSQTFPMMHENAYLVERFNHGFTFWVYGSMCFLCILFVWRCIPETKGKSLEEIEDIWK